MIDCNSALCGPTILNYLFSYTSTYWTVVIYSVTMDNFILFSIFKEAHIDYSHAIQYFVAYS